MLINRLDVSTINSENNFYSWVSLEFFQIAFLMHFCGWNLFPFIFNLEIFLEIFPEIFPGEYSGL